MKSLLEQSPLATIFPSYAKVSNGPPLHIPAASCNILTDEQEEDTHCTIKAKHQY
jgi:hypothetical protein